MNKTNVMSKEELRIERTKYRILLENYFSQKKYNTNYTKTILIFISQSILISAFFTWCSSGDTSYFPLWIKEQQEIVMYIVAFLPHFFSVFLISIPTVFSAKNVQKSLEIQNLLYLGGLREIYLEFIKIDNIKFLKKEEQIIDFREDKLVDYIKNKYEKSLKIDYHILHYLARLIILDEVIEKKLILTSDSTFYYVYKVADICDIYYK